MKVEWPRRWTWSQRIRQAIALAGYIEGARLPDGRRCRQCGAPCRSSGGYDCPVIYDRNSCTNERCANYTPF